MANGSITIKGGSITIEFDREFTASTDPSGNYKFQSDKKMTEVVVINNQDEAYMKFNVKSLPQEENFLIKVNYEAAEKGAAAGTS